jgi:hypothetical protein
LVDRIDHVWVLVQLALRRVFDALDNAPRCLTDVLRDLRYALNSGLSNAADPARGGQRESQVEARDR